MSVFRGAEERGICLSPQENQPNVDLVENKTGGHFCRPVLATAILLIS